MALQPKKLLPYAMAGWLSGGRKHCVFCDHRVWRFMPYRGGSRGTPPLLQALDCVGSDVDHFECPRCGSSDRERHLLLYFRAGGLMEWVSGKSILHFAPEKHLSPRIQAMAPARYIRCDLFPQLPGIERVDMLDMPFDSCTFDMVIANHVLEHVNDVAKALLEIHRVLKRGGYAVLQTPYSARLQRTWSDPGIDTPKARLEAYGQEDHVRLFGSDIFDLISASGFESRVQWHANALDAIDPVITGVNPNEPFFLFEKPN